MRRSKLSLFLIFVIIFIVPQLIEAKEHMLVCGKEDGIAKVWYIDVDASLTSGKSVVVGEVELKDENRQVITNTPLGISANLYRESKRTDFFVSFVDKKIRRFNQSGYPIKMIDNSSLAWSMPNSVDGLGMEYYQENLVYCSKEANKVYELMYNGNVKRSWGISDVGFSPNGLAWFFDRIWLGGSTGIYQMGSWLDQIAGKLVEGARLDTDEVSGISGSITEQWWEQREHRKTLFASSGNDIYKTKLVSPADFYTINYGRYTAFYSQTGMYEYDVELILPTTFGGLGYDIRVEGDSTYIYTLCSDGYKNIELWKSLIVFQGERLETGQIVHTRCFLKTLPDEWRITADGSYFDVSIIRASKGRGIDFYDNTKILFLVDAEEWGDEYRDLIFTIDITGSSLEYKGFIPWEFSGEDMICDLAFDGTNLYLSWYYDTGGILKYPEHLWKSFSKWDDGIKSIYSGRDIFNVNVALDKLFVFPRDGEVLIELDYNGNVLNKVYGDFSVISDWYVGLASVYPKSGSALPPEPGEPTWNIVGQFTAPISEPEGIATGINLSKVANIYTEPIPFYPSLEGDKDSETKIRYTTIVKPEKATIQIANPFTSALIKTISVEEAEFKEITHGKLWDEYETEWDGKDAQNNIVSKGIYSLKMQLKDKAGAILYDSYSSSQLYVYAWAPTIAFSKATFQYKLWGWGEPLAAIGQVYMNIYDDEFRLVKRLLVTNEAKAGEMNTAEWNYLPYAPGRYYYTIWGEDDRGNQAHIRGGKFTVPEHKIKGERKPEEVESGWETEGAIARIRRPAVVLYSGEGHIFENLYAEQVYHALRYNLDYKTVFMNAASDIVAPNQWLLSGSQNAWNMNEDTADALLNHTAVFYYIGHSGFIKVAPERSWIVDSLGETDDLKKWKLFARPYPALPQEPGSSTFPDVDSLTPSPKLAFLFSCRSFSDDWRNAFHASSYLGFIDSVFALLESSIDFNYFFWDEVSKPHYSVKKAYWQAVHDTAQKHKWNPLMWGVLFYYSTPVLRGDIYLK